MCGRFTLHISPELLAEIFGLTEIPVFPARYNIAPTQQVAAIRRHPDGTKHLDFLQWGLIPSWAKDNSIGHKLINARSETVHEKPAFKYDLHHHRCLVPASGFYEWQLVEKKKHPLYVKLKEDKPMVFAGLWDHWKAPEGEVVESCTILTTASNTLLQPVHDRMPVILDPKDYGLWLNPSISEIESLKYLFEPCPSKLMEMYQVSDIVNSPKNDTPECIQPTGLPINDMEAIHGTQQELQLPRKS
jgi:putative SOS response-associated peptidase YedK